MKKLNPSMHAIHLYNTLTRRTDVFSPIVPGKAGLYTCGPTVYGEAHIGNLRTYVFEDLLRRTLEYFGYDVLHVMNVTDVGHLTSDADAGEDKMQVGSRREGVTAWQIAEKYAKIFFEDIAALNIKAPKITCKATDHIPEQIALVKALEDKGFTYVTDDGVYFDTSKFPDYGKMARLDIDGLKAGARIEMDDQKRNKTDFALWKFSPAGEKRDMEWDSPWGRGFPGWHIECSAMSTKYLGPHFDIHAGGIDHVPIHHTNEIAQSEAALGQSPWVNYWIHGEFLVMDKDKMSKSKGGTLTIRTLQEKGISPLVYRYFCLGTHYRKQLSFSWEGLAGAADSYARIREIMLDLKAAGGHAQGHLKQTSVHDFDDAIADDLNTPQALAVFWTMLRDESLSKADKYALALRFDEVFGLGILEMKEETFTIPTEVQSLVVKREEMRKAKNWAEADKIRAQILAHGFELLDTATGPKLKKA